MIPTLPLILKLGKGAELQYILRLLIAPATRIVAPYCDGYPSLMTLQAVGYPCLKCLLALGYLCF